MRYLVAYLAGVGTLFGMGCSEEAGPPAKPEPRWVVHELGDTSQVDGEVRLSLKVLVVSDGTRETLSIEATVEKVGSGLIRYDAGGCGCDNPGVRIENGNGEACRVVRRMCPCWPDIHELSAEDSVLWAELYPVEACVAGTSEAFADFHYTMFEAGEWVCHDIEARLEVTVGTSP